jgi:hypothetical protein
VEQKALPERGRLRPLFFALCPQGMGGVQGRANKGARLRILLVGILDEFEEDAVVEGATVGPLGGGR